MRHNIITSKPSGILCAKGLFIMEMKKEALWGESKMTETGSPYCKYARFIYLLVYVS